MDLISCVFSKISIIYFIFFFGKKFFLFDMLTRIRNSNYVKLSRVYVLQTNLTISICKLLKNEGFIQSYDLNYLVLNNLYLSISLKYKGYKQKPYITCVKRVSKLSLRKYVKVSQIPKIRGGVGLAVFLFNLKFFSFNEFS